MAKKTAAQHAPTAQPVPSIYDTHCEGPGLSASTLPWSWAYTVRLVPLAPAGLRADRAC